MEIRPQWSAWDGKPFWMREDTAERDAGGGPGLFERMAFAGKLENWLNGK